MGQEPARRWAQPIPVVDVVRAALSEVENYERVTTQGVADAAVVGTSVNDVIHLVAELVENALAFSPPQTRVMVSTNRIDGGGHGWPGGPQLMPSRMIGPVSKHLDATGLLLDMAGRETAVASGWAPSRLDRWESA